MKRELEAVFDGQVFRPETPVAGLRKGARVRLSVEYVRGRDREPTDTARQPAKIALRTSEIEELARAAFAGMTDAEDAAMRAAQLDQQHFFDHQHS
jgi:uncharacterized protein (DUF1684 family)